MSDRRLTPFIVPLFIPYQGCPHRCIFCHQEKITSQSTSQVDGTFIQSILDKALTSPGFASGKEREIAFYGGTFTSLSAHRIRQLLSVVEPYIKQGFFTSIRISTRPDQIDEKKLDLLRRGGVTTVELGAQSLDNEVLVRSRRGHSVHDTVKSFHLLKRYGFRVGIQLMPGLPGDSEEIFRRTVGEVIGLRPDMVRLYPTVVIAGTALARWYQTGRYRPLSLEDALRICEDACIRLESKGIPVIRLGLMSSPSLLQADQILAGPWHTAFGFLVRSGIHQKMIEPYLPKRGDVSKIGLRAPKREIPLVRGYKNRGICVLEEKTGAEIAYIYPDDTVPHGRVEVDVL